MAIAKSPLFSSSASGTLGKTIVFSEFKGKSVVKGNRLKVSSEYYMTQKPYHSQTQEQEGVREYFKQAVNSWNQLSQSQKNAYNYLAIGKAKTGFNLFMSETLLSIYDAARKTLEWVYAQGFNIGLLSFSDDSIKVFMQAELFDN